MAALGHDRGARVMSPQEAQRQSHRQAAFAQIEFATDSPLEGDGFELPVPRAMQARLKAKIAGFACMRSLIIWGCRFPDPVEKAPLAIRGARWSEGERTLEIQAQLCGVWPDAADPPARYSWPAETARPRRFGVVIEAIAYSPNSASPTKPRDQSQD